MQKSIVALSLALATIAPVWAAPAKGTAPRPAGTIIYRAGSVRIQAASRGGIIIHRGGDVRIRSSVAHRQSVVTMTKA